MLELVNEHVRFYLSKGELRIINTQWVNQTICLRVYIVNRTESHCGLMPNDFIRQGESAGA